MTITLSLREPVTDEDLRILAERNPGYQFERNAGGALVVTPTGGDTGRRNADLVTQLSLWNQRTGIGVVFDSSTGVLLPDGSLLSPDAAWLRRERWHALSPSDRERFPPVCPDAVFELASPHSDPSQLRAKMLAWTANGAALAVLIDPQRRTVDLFRPGQPPHTVHERDVLSLDPELPGLALDLARLFA